MTDITVVTTQRKLTQSIIKQMPIAPLHILRMCETTKEAVIGYVVLPKASYYLIEMNCRYYRLRKCTFQQSIHYKSRLVVPESNRYDEFASPEEALDYLAIYNRIKELGDRHIYI